MKRKIFLAIAIMVFMLGVWGILTRKDPIEKNIGYVYLIEADKATALKGHKVSVNYHGKTSEYDYPEISSEKDKIYRASISQENSDKMSLTYSKKTYGDAVFNLYDSDLNLISENETTLNIPGVSGEVYYVSVSVSWGSESENVNMVYYFSVQT